MATSRKIIGSIIKFHRKQKDMTLQALGDKVGKDRQYMWRIENGEINTTMDLLEEIIRALGCKHSDFFNQNKNNPTK